MTLDLKKIGRTRAVVKEGDPLQLKTAEESVQVDTEEETEEEDEHETSKTRRLKAKETPSIEEIKKWDTGMLIDFLQKQGLDIDFDIFHTQGITGKIFLELTKKELQSCGLKLGPAKVIAELIKEIKEAKRRTSSSYQSLKEVLNKYGIEGNSIGNISQFTPGKIFLVKEFGRVSIKLIVNYQKKNLIASMTTTSS